MKEDLLQEWKRLQSAILGAEAITIPRCYSKDAIDKSQLIGFCDASAKAYAAVVYLRLENGSTASTKFLASKTRVAPAKGATIPRLELLSALLLAKLMDSIQTAQN